MTEKLKDTISVPNWIVILFFSTIVGLFATGWKQVDSLRDELTVERTSRIYIEKKLDKIDLKLDRVLDKLDKHLEGNK